MCPKQDKMRMVTGYQVNGKQLLVASKFDFININSFWLFSKRSVISIDYVNGEGSPSCIFNVLCYYNSVILLFVISCRSRSRVLGTAIASNLTDSGRLRIIFLPGPFARHRTNRGPPQGTIRNYSSGTLYREFLFILISQILNSSNSTTRYLLST